MQLSVTDRVFALTGAGISAESGLATFRGSGGLWNGHSVEQVATPEAWEADPALVWSFYSMRRRDAEAAQPNPAHFAFSKLQKKIGERLFLCTQNVDDLHERAGATSVHHMHGSLFESRCVKCNLPFADREQYDGELPNCKSCGSPVRPHIVWFGEVPLAMDMIYDQLDYATVLLVVGTSGSVYPAAGFVHSARQRGIQTIYVGPEEPLNARSFHRIELGTASAVLPHLF